MDSSVYNNNEDHMEIGETGFVTTENGWMVNDKTGFTRDPEGRVYDANGEVVFDPMDEDEYEHDYEDDYEWYN